MSARQKAHSLGACVELPSLPAVALETDSLELFIRPLLLILFPHFRRKQTDFTGGAADDKIACEEN